MLLYVQFLDLIADYWKKVQLFYMSYSWSWLFSAINYFFLKVISTSIYLQ